MNSRNLYAEAFDYVLDGLSIIWLNGIRLDGACTCEKSQCGSPGKHPLHLDWVNEATRSPKQLKRWAKKHPTGNVGIATGENSGVFVLDIDPGHGGQSSLEALEEEFGALPVTPTVETGGGGSHYYFAYPSGLEVRNRAGVRPGIDVRGEGGYVVAPPSRHALGGEYRWREDQEFGSIPTAEAPPWLLDLITQPKKKRTSSRGEGEDGIIPEGERNAVLTSLAGTMQHRGMSADAINSALQAENELKCEPPLPEAEVEAIVRSIGRYDPAQTPEDRLRRAGLTHLDATSSMDAITSGIRNLVDLVDGADPLEREATQLAAALLLRGHGQTAEAAKKLIAAGFKSRRKAEEPQASANLLVDPTPWPGAVDGAVLLDDLAEIISRYVLLPECCADIVALWTVFAHAHDSFSISPLLTLTSPTKRCGKSTLIELLLHLTPRPLQASNISPAALFRSIEKWEPTLLIDEGDTFLGLDPQYVNLLNGSHKKALAFVIRCEGEGYEPRQFKTWSPKVIAHIGALPPTVHDRSIEIRMRRKLPTEKVERLRHDHAAKLFTPLLRKGWAWAKEHEKDILDPEPEVPDVLDDRAQDNWRVLFKVADVVGGDWPGRTRRAALTVGTDPAGREQAIAILLLEDLYEIFVRFPEDSASLRTARGRATCTDASSTVSSSLLCSTPSASLPVCSGSRRPMRRCAAMKTSGSPTSSSGISVGGTTHDSHAP